MGQIKILSTRIFSVGNVQLSVKKVQLPPTSLFDPDVAGSGQCTASLERAFVGQDNHPLSL